MTWLRMLIGTMAARFLGTVRAASFPLWKVVAGFAQAVAGA